MARRRKVMKARRNGKTIAKPNFEGRAPAKVAWHDLMSAGQAISLGPDFHINWRLREVVLDSIERLHAA